MFPSDIPNLEPKKQGENGWQPIRGRAAMAADQALQDLKG
jgi:hypothetical protein